MPDLEFFNKRIDDTVLETLTHVVNSDFEHVTYTEAIRISWKRRGTEDTRGSFRSSGGADLQSEHERYLTEQTFKKPVIVTDYPKEIKAFYMRAERRRQDRARDGRSRPAYRRDHRGQPARGAL